MEEKRRDVTGTPPSAAGSMDVAPSEQPTSRRRGGQKRKSSAVNSGGGSSNPHSTSSKRQAREKPPVVPFPPIHMNGPCTRARVQPSNTNSFSPAEALVKSELEAREAAMKMEETGGYSENWEALEAKIEAEYEAVRSREANVHVVPIHAGWFSWTKIHALEEKMLPSFFNGKIESRTPEIYMEIRNWIMKKYHFNPNEQIELKDLSELTVGELDARQEVMEFLDYWGLINYHPLPQNEPAPLTVDADDDEAGKTDSLLTKLFQFESIESWNPLVPRINTVVPAVSSGLFPESVIADELVKSEGPAVEYHCNSCQADCSRKRYHCQTQADFDLCAECFNNGKFGSDMSPSDFILMEPAEAGGGGGGKWTDQETLLLLEAIEIFRDNWSEIAEHVATKTKAQCILHFVQMPIEDAFFNQDDKNNVPSKENGLPISIGNENPSPKIDEDGDTAIKDVPEKTESEAVTTKNQTLSCPVETSKPQETHESDKTCDVQKGFVLKALKEAFEAVGSLPSLGERLSFAEAGNPVMTLAAFLVRLVKPNITTASVRSFLKSLSSKQTSEQLAARHCFCLEDPPHNKNPAGSEGTATEKIELKAKKDEGEHTEKQNDETPISVEDISLLQDGNKEKKDSAAVGNCEKESASEENREKKVPSSEENKENKDSASEDKKRVASLSVEGADKSDTLKKPEPASHEETRSGSLSDPTPSDYPKEPAPKVAEESIASTSHAEVQLDSLQESDVASARDISQSEKPLKDENTSNSGQKETELLLVSNSITDKEENTGGRESKDCRSTEKGPLIDDMDVGISKLKRAAMTALSAAAVKAKLFADQEEDQIRQLSVFLIEKQLHKLETKLTFFNDMENVVMRVKEQLDRSKQRLFQERAQIIATRFGMPPSARPNTQVLLPNRAVAAFPNSATRSFMGLNSLRPPVSRPIMTPNPGSNTLMSASASGSPLQPSAD